MRWRKTVCALGYCRKPSLGNPADEAHHPDPLLQRGRAAAADARRPAARGGGLRRRRVAGDRRRLDRRDGRGRARARRRPPRAPDQQQGPRGRLPGGHRHGAEARRRRDRQHRRRQPVLRRRTSRSSCARSSTGAPTWCRRPRGRRDRALLAAEEGAAAPRLVGRAPGLLDLGARHDLGLPRLQPRGGDPDAGRLEVHLHAGDDHPGRQAAGRDRPRPGPHQPEDARVAPVPLDGRLRAPQRGLDLPHLRPVRAAARVLEPRRC